MVKQFVKQCQTCGKLKLKGLHLLGFCIPKRPLAVIFLDFIEGLSKSRGYDVVIMVVDKFSKYDHFISMKHHYIVLSVAMAFIHNIFKLHGLPLAIISDRDRVFTINLWQRNVQTRANSTSDELILPSAD